MLLVSSRGVTGFFNIHRRLETEALGFLLAFYFFFELDHAVLELSVFPLYLRELVLQDSLEDIDFLEHTADFKVFLDLFMSI